MNEAGEIKMPHVKMREWRNGTIVEFHKSKDCTDRFPLSFGAGKAQAMLTAIKVNGLENVMMMLEQLAEEKPADSG